MAAACASDHFTSDRFGNEAGDADEADELEQGKFGW